MADLRSRLAEVTWERDRLKELMTGAGFDPAHLLKVFWDQHHANDRVVVETMEERDGLYHKAATLYTALEGVMEIVGGLDLKGRSVQLYQQGQEALALVL